MDSKVIDQIKNICKYLKYDATRLLVDCWCFPRNELAKQVNKDTFDKMTEQDETYFKVNMDTLEVIWENCHSSPRFTSTRTVFKLTSELILNNIHKDLYKLAKATAAANAMEKLKKQLTIGELKEAGIDFK